MFQGQYFKLGLSASASVVLSYITNDLFAPSPQNMMYLMTFIAPACFAYVFAAFSMVEADNPYRRYPVSLHSVHDGDTLKLGLGGRVSSYRLRFIDTPELDQDGGEDAAAKLAQLVHGKYLEISFDESNQSSYNRNVCILYANGVNVGLEMLRRGYAWIDTRYYVAPEYQDAFNEGVRERRGIFKNVNESGSNMPTHPREFVNKKKDVVDLTNALDKFTNGNKAVRSLDANKL